jgi:carboxypeptidase C (cathepsin A)
LLLLIECTQTLTNFNYQNLSNITTGNSQTDVIPNIVTSCNILNFVTTYNYSGIVAGGYLSVAGKGNSALAYTFYGKKDLTDLSQLKNYPTVLWLGGGPGTSSQQGNLQEIGPLLLIRDFDVQIVQNNYTWANNYNLLFIDQPVGTGLSYIDNSNRFAKTLDCNYLIKKKLQTTCMKP